MKEHEINALRNDALHDQIKTERQAKVYPGAMDDCDATLKIRLAQSGSSENVSLADDVYQLLQSSEYLNHSIAKKIQEISELKQSNELLAKKVEFQTSELIEKQKYILELEAMVPRWSPVEQWHLFDEPVLAYHPDWTMSVEKSHSGWPLQIGLCQDIATHYMPLPQPPKGESQ